MILLYTSILGLISGLVWGTVFNNTLFGMWIGAITGCIIGLLFVLFSGMARLRSRVHKNETATVNVALTTVLGIFVTILGLVALIIKAIFF
jgi:hypothetical protein